MSILEKEIFKRGKLIYVPCNPFLVSFLINSYQLLGSRREMVGFKAGNISKVLECSQEISQRGQTLNHWRTVRATRLHGSNRIGRVYFDQVPTGKHSRRHFTPAVRSRGCFDCLQVSYVTYPMLHLFVLVSFCLAVTVNMFCHITQI